ncbi:MAG: type I-U CRISPR-associated protein Cas7, partial [Alicyclobacillus sp.]|nr:type I-U CRISPR-associated protein Cas7 [Alicyclobacillus sp.]
FALFKIQRFLHTGLRLRSACDLRCLRLEVTQPAGWQPPELAELNDVLPQWIGQLRSEQMLAEPLSVTYRKRR